MARTPLWRAGDGEQLSVATYKQYQQKAVHNLWISLWTFQLNACRIGYFSSM
jgi:hypothetical protein